MKKHIITSGSKYIDIDVLACGVAYKKLLNILGQEASFISSAPFNDTIPNSIREWELSIEQKPDAIKSDSLFILVDVSDPLYFESFVNHNSIYKIYDHHFGFEKYWENILGGNSIIQHVGSCATLIWEEFQKYNCVTKIDYLSANLLYTAIFANTLNLKAAVTHPRDTKALNELKPYIRLPENWISEYYKEIEASILNNTKNAIEKDLKNLCINSKNISIGQIELWDSSKILNQKNILALVKSSFNLTKAKPDIWFLIVSDIKKGINFIITDHERSKTLLSNIFQINFKKNIGTTNKLFMRKEIIRDINKTGV